MIRIETLDRSQAGQYEAFLLSSPTSLVYASAEFAAFLLESVGGEYTCLVAWDGNEIVGALPLFTRTAPAFGSVVNSLPWYGSYGGCTLRSGDDGEVRRLLVTRYREMIEAEKPLSSVMILSPFENPHLSEYEALLAPSHRDSRIGQITVLPEGPDRVEEKLFGTYRQKTRNLVRKSLLQGMTCRVSDGEEVLRFLFETHQENMEAVGGKAKPWLHFEALRKSIPASRRSVWLALLGDTPVAAMLLIYFNKTVEYVTPVVKVDYRSLQPLSFLIHHAMTDAVEKGYRYWNWGGTWLTQSSLHHFKAGWGAADCPYTYLIHASDESVAAIRKNIEDVQAAYPYYYVFPYDRL
jgi:hypothetical protein